MDFVNLLAKRRRERNLTQDQLGSLTEPRMDGNRISDLETRGLPTRLIHLKRVATALQVPLDDLIGEVAR